MNERKRKNIYALSRVDWDGPAETGWTEREWMRARRRRVARQVVIDVVVLVFTLIVCVAIDVGLALWLHP